jgi:cobaltochelatase CobN
MVATIRALTGADPKAYVGDSTSPDAIRTRSLTEETARVFRARVIIRDGLQRCSGTVTKGRSNWRRPSTTSWLRCDGRRVTDWMYQQLAENYVLDKDNQDFMKHANPWALRGIIEKLSEAVDRGLWQEPDPELITSLQQVYLDVEGDLEEAQ